MSNKKQTVTYSKNKAFYKNANEMNLFGVEKHSDIEKENKSMYLPTNLRSEK